MQNYPGWTLDEVKSLTSRERRNWLEIVKINIVSGR